MKPIHAFFVRILLFVSVVSLIQCGGGSYPYPFQNPKLSPQKRADDLVSRLTLEEKALQMQNWAPGIERLGIPSYDWWSEALHGVARAGIATVFPQAIGLAATWNTDLMHRLASVISDEARAKHHDFVRQNIRGMNTGLTFWSPNVNLFRDPRWGRGQETYGEDPYLSGRMGVAFVKGMQGDNPRYFKTIATPKHYAVHSGPEPERHRFDAVANDRDLFETYLPAFKACMTEGGAWSIMGAYNRTNGEACCAHPRLLGNILREEWGFKGYVVSDCGAITDIYAGHRLAADAAEASAMAVKNGCDLTCGNEYRSLLQAVERGLITEKEIDVSARRLFEARIRLGMFDPQEKVPYASIPVEVNDSEANRAASLQAARESIVLLKNENTLLPLKKDMKNLLVVGPNADFLESLLGNYNGTPSRAVTPLEGIKNKVSKETQVHFTLGCGWTDATVFTPVPSSALRPETGSAETGLTARYFNNMLLEGKPVLERVDECVDFSWDMAKPAPEVRADTFSVRWTGILAPPESGDYIMAVTGDDGYRLYIGEKLIIDNWREQSPTTRSAAVPMRAGREYPIQLEYYDKWYGADIHLSWCLPNVDPMKEALDMALESDAVIMVGGISPRLEGEEMPVEIPGFFGGDRTEISLPVVQTDLLKALQATGKPVVLVLLSGSAFALPWEKENIPAILEAWYPGEEGGTAIADVIFGDYNPAGRLPVTFYASVDQLPPFEDYSMEDRTYRYFKGKPCYPFGFGLSYTSFDYSNLILERNTIKKNQNLELTVDVENTGGTAGDEVVQLYLADLEASTERPIKSLKGFRRIHLAPGEKTTVAFQLTREDLSMINDKNQWVIEPGAFEALIGASSEDIRLKAGFEVVE
jgi:beta-glucosidase